MFMRAFRSTNPDTWLESRRQVALARNMCVWDPVENALAHVKQEVVALVSVEEVVRRMSAASRPETIQHVTGMSHQPPKDRMTHAQAEVRIHGLQVQLELPYLASDDSDHVLNVTLSAVGVPWRISRIIDAIRVS